jgi:hypothetical protein
LIGGDETAQCVGVEARVGVRDQCQGDCVDPRITLQLAAGEFREFAIVAFRQILPNLA